MAWTFFIRENVPVQRFLQSYYYAHVNLWLTRQGPFLFQYLDFVVWFCWILGKWILWWILLALIVLLNLVGQFVMIALTFPQNGCHQPSPFTGNVTLDWIHRQKLKWFWNLKNKFLKNHTNVDSFSGTLLHECISRVLELILYFWKLFD